MLDIICGNWTSTIASIDGEDFIVACVGSRFNVAPIDTLKLIR